MHSEILDTVIKENKFIKHLSSVQSIPALPMVMIEVSKLLDNPSSSATELAHVITKDQGISAKILAVANSPLFGLPRKVSTIEFAILVLGFKHIQEIILALTLLESLKESDSESWDNQSYWLHCLMTATAAQRIANDFGYIKTGEAFTAGLLHDLGISIIHRYFKKQYLEIVRESEFNNEPFIIAEQKILGITHQEIGYYFLERWKLPEKLGYSILHHHNPINSENKVLSSIIHLADYMTEYLNIGSFLWDKNMALDPEMLHVLKLGDETRLADYIESYRDLFIDQVETLKY
jgi:putative nucleotidyltransferase with HDIG domain